jgi:hypothetical protein
MKKKLQRTFYQKIAKSDYLVKKSPKYKAMGLLKLGL